MDDPYWYLVNDPFEFPTEDQINDWNIHNDHADDGSLDEGDNASASAPDWTWE